MMSWGCKFSHKIPEFLTGYTLKLAGKNLNWDCIGHFVVIIIDIIVN